MSSPNLARHLMNLFYLKCQFVHLFIFTAICISLSATSLILALSTHISPLMNIESFSYMLQIFSLIYHLLSNLFFRDISHFYVTSCIFFFSSWFLASKTYLAYSYLPQTLKHMFTNVYL